MKGSSSFQLDNFTRETVKHMSPYSSARDEYQEISRDMVFIDANENPYENGVNRYPDPQQLKVKQRLSELKDISTDKILLGNGSDEVLDLVVRAFCEPNRDQIIILPPTYGMYKVLANINAIGIIEVELTENFQPDVNTILSAASAKTKVLFICSPNNPTANSFEGSLIEKLIREFDGLVVIDEAYIDFSKEQSWISRLPEFPNLIVTQTMSKAFGMAGIRLGVCFASKDIIAILNRIKPPYNVNELTQRAALERLNAIDEVRAEVDSILEQRQLLMVELQKSTIIKRVFDSDANFILAKVDDANKRYKQLIAQGIVVRNRSSQPLCDNCLRFTVGTASENNRLINAINALD